MCCATNRFNGAPMRLHSSESKVDEVRKKYKHKNNIINEREPNNLIVAFVSMSNI